MQITEIKADYPFHLLLLADPSEELVREYCERGRCFIGAKEDEEIVAVYVLLPTRPATVELVNIVIAEEYQGKGLGKKVVLHAIDQAKWLGFHTVEIGTGSTGVAQLSLYQKCGFRITGVDRDFFLRHYSQPIFENGVQVIDMVRLSMDLHSG
ncbi:GNAT family N-acetyltransferase [Aureibacillus halotolerans]|uniref:GNAT family N-acetyltransferase n=1 Tax=Aureibacillus halotolerans TaxID=1508390 RepID=UPI00105E4E6C|nr:GNAT family N-acetyltransferase [Aureibacillus halotolerans]